jgi:cytochrome c oxidase subunit II
MGFDFFPERASEIARDVDLLFSYLVGVSAVFAFGIAFCIVRFSIKYRRRPGDPPPPAVHGNLALELLWIVVPLALAMSMFAWGAAIFLRNAHAPAGADEIYVVGKQWMWKVQHLSGRREINALHLPVGRPVKLIMTSEDVIHSFFVPAFRTKADVLPGRYTMAWFDPVKTGDYELYCAEYCGTGHSTMIGRVVVMEPARFQEWLGGGVPGETLVEAGARLFGTLGCATCHSSTSGARGPHLAGLFGKEVRLRGGGTALVDEGYLRESILEPQAKIVEGYEPIMPTSKGQVSEEDLVRLLAYLKSLAPPPGGNPK